jgi:hypothetical protein
MDGRIVGVTAATVTLIVLWFFALGLFTSLPGVLLAGLMAAIAGSGVGAVADPSRSGRTAAVVVGYIAILLIGYMLNGTDQNSIRGLGSRGGLDVMPTR